MTKRKGMTKAEAFKALETRVEHIEVATRVSQSLLQRFGQSFSGMETDITQLANSQREIQYKLLAITKMLEVDDNLLTAKVEELQIVDFEEASAKEDTEKLLTVIDVADEHSIIVFTSKAADEGKDILRSKVDLDSLNHPDFLENVVGKTVGDSFPTDINGVQHEITLLEIKAKPLEEKKEATTDSEVQ